MLPREAWACDAAEFRCLTPLRSLQWLWKSNESIPITYFIRLADTGCHDWRAWETRAVLLLLAGYGVRDVSYGAARALRRRGEVLAARGLLRQWIREGVLERWMRVIRDSGAGPNDPATVHRAIAQRDAMIARRERASWACTVASGVIQPQVNRKAVSDGLSCAAQGKSVRFAV